MRAETSGDEDDLERDRLKKEAQEPHPDDGWRRSHLESNSGGQASPSHDRAADRTDPAADDSGLDSRAEPEGMAEKASPYEANTPSSAESADVREPGGVVDLDLDTHGDRVAGPVDVDTHVGEPGDTATTDVPAEASMDTQKAAETSESPPTQAQTAEEAGRGSDLAAEGYLSEHGEMPAGGSHQHPRSARDSTSDTDLPTEYPLSHEDQHKSAAPDAPKTGDQSDGRPVTPMDRWEAREEKVLRDNADFFDLEAQRYREQGNGEAAHALQAAADRARSFITEESIPQASSSPEDGGGDQTTPMARREAAEDRILSENADYFDSEAQRYHDLGNEEAATALQEAADRARSYIADSPVAEDAPPAVETTAAADLPRESSLDAIQDQPRNPDAVQAREDASDDSPTTGDYEATDLAYGRLQEFRDQYPGMFRAALDSDPRPDVAAAFESPSAWVDRINPRGPDRNGGGGEVGRNVNCVDCARSVERVWRGDPEISSANMMGGEDDNGLEDWAEMSLSDTSFKSISDQLGELGPGASALIVGYWPSGGGHAFNAVNSNGEVIFVDAQPLGGATGPWPPRGTSPGYGYEEADFGRISAIFRDGSGRSV